MKKQEYDDSKRYGGSGDTGGYTFNFKRGSKFDPFDLFKDVFGKRDPFFDNDEDDIFSNKNIFRGFSGFKGFDDDDGFFNMRGNGNFKFSSSSSSTGGPGMKTSIKKTTQIM
jgi:hypothetical protein